MTIHDEIAAWPRQPNYADGLICVHGEFARQCNACWWAHECARSNAIIATMREVLTTCQWALRQPLDEWKGDCERRALDDARAVLAQLEKDGLA